MFRWNTTVGADIDKALSFDNAALRLKKPLHTAANAIFLEDIKEEGRPFKSRFLQAGLVKYDFGVCLLKKETIDKFIDTFIDCPVIINHSDNIKQEDVKGKINNIWFSKEDGWFWCSGIITDDKAINLIENEGYNVSCQYQITEYAENIENKLHNGNPYDKEILNGVFEHLAIVDNPRYEGAIIAVNAYVAKNAICRNNFKEQDHPRDEEGKFTDGGNTQKIDISQDEYTNPQKDYNLPQLSSKVLDKLGKKQKPLVLKKNIIEKNKNNHKELNIEEYNDILNKGLYETDIVFKNKSNDEYFNFVHYGEDKNPQVLIELSETKDNYEIVNFYKMRDKSLNEKLKKAIKRVDFEDDQPLIDNEDLTSKNSGLSAFEINSIYIINDDFTDFNPTAKNKVENDIDNINLPEFIEVLKAIDDCKVK